MPPGRNRQRFCVHIARSLGSSLCGLGCTRFLTYYFPAWDKGVNWVGLGLRDRYARRLFFFLRVRFAFLICLPDFLWGLPTHTPGGT
jgi:hypothetical protein